MGFYRVCLDSGRLLLVSWMMRDKANQEGCSCSVAVGKVQHLHSFSLSSMPLLLADQKPMGHAREKNSLTLKLITQGILCKTHELSLSHCSLSGRSSLCLSSATALKLPHPERIMGKNAMGFICFGSSSSQNHRDDP